MLNRPPPVRPPRRGRSPPRRLAAGLLAAVVLAGGMVGCAQPPPFIAVNHQRVVPLAAPEVWRRVHAFLQDQGVQVVSEDRVAGLIDARQDVVSRGLLAAYADCGRPGPFAPPEERQTLDLTVRIKPVQDGAEVTAQAAFSRTLRARHAAALTVACASTGVLEAAVLNVASGQPMEAAVVPR